MAKSHQLTITVTILLAFIYQGGTADPPKGPGNGIAKPPVDKPGNPPVAVLPPAVLPPAVLPPAVLPPAVLTTTRDIHGGVPMGVPNPDCDDGIRNIQKDYDKRILRKVCYCMGGGKGRKDFPIVQQLRHHQQAAGNAPVVPVEAKEVCEPKQAPTHKCMKEDIIYDSKIPTSGIHRPLWPKYGEYVYLPPQRWVHNLEHGGIVFLYHPCADPEQINQLRTIAYSCLHKIIITPMYDKSIPEYPFAVVSWGCKLLLPAIDKVKIRAFITEKALTAPETHAVDEGQYDVGLISAVGKTEYEGDGGTKCPVDGPKGAPPVKVNNAVTKKNFRAKHTSMKKCKNVFVKAGILKKWKVRPRRPWRYKPKPPQNVFNRWNRRKYGTRGSRHKNRRGWKNKGKGRKYGRRGKKNKGVGRKRGKGRKYRGRGKKRRRN